MTLSYTKNIKMKSENEYIGDDKFKKFLEHYNCPSPLDIVKLRFAGAICSPNNELRPTDVISSLWPDNHAPRLETKKEAELFFKFFMGLWDEMFQNVCQNQIALPEITESSDIRETCLYHGELLEHGFLEGFWGGKDNVTIPAYIAEIVDSLSRMASLYETLAAKVSPNTQQTVQNAVRDCDATVNKSISFIIQHFVLPHMDELKRMVN